ncbi:sugar phosphate isomerase/epimerase [Mesorhizobium sp. CGMCC 1.15528]|uniref:Sugar phosphate isomerase/epimerase n=1 Tax=Mesorhizobium zhangyense TaxID=1776730 RepID=A0A7C9R8U1_9HYPH|nr:TIM barrel protein [Mesorhizobium zhangyense]NGN42994.1 sugar phosphate isomerase/epimerase [Mesorhizobium zhangyense]
MTRLLSLAHLTALSLTPPELIRVAAETGYQAVGLRLVAVTPETPSYPLMDDPMGLRETRAALADTGIRILDVEFLRLEPTTEPAKFLPVLETAAELGASQVLLAAYDPDESRLVHNVAALADLAHPLGLTVNLEFYPWTVVSCLADAERVVAASDAANAGILVDALHLARSSTTLAELRASPANRYNYLHLCDASADHPGSLEGLLLAARAERLAPGDGGLDLAGFLSAMPADLPIGLEVPMERMTAELGPATVARLCREAATRLMKALQ